MENQTISEPCFRPKYQKLFINDSRETKIHSFLERDRCVMHMLGAICRSERSTDRAALLEDLLFAQPSIDRATTMFARSTDRAGMVLRDRPIVQEWFCAIDRSCRNGFARSTDRAGIDLSDPPIVQESI